MKAWQEPVGPDWNQGCGIGLRVLSEWVQVYESCLNGSRFASPVWMGPGLWVLPSGSLGLIYLLFMHCIWFLMLTRTD